ncbi:MAG: universal stress protein [Dehalococcoidia bacterium]
MKILVCTDGSAPSLAVVPHVRRLATALDAEVTLVRVLDSRVDAASEVAARLNDAVAVVRAGWEKELEETLAGAGIAGTVAVPVRQWGKDTADAILHTAKDTGADLIAIATRGTGAIRHALLGSVAMGVISKTTLPVLTVAESPAERTGNGPYHIVVTTDGSPDSLSIFAALNTILVPEKTRVTLLEIIRQKGAETVDEARERLQSLVANFPEGVEATVHVRAVPESANIAATIINAATELHADAIASATHGHSARRHLVAGSTALGVVGSAGMPVILVKSSAAG